MPQLCARFIPPRQLAESVEDEWPGLQLAETLEARLFQLACSGSAAAAGGLGCVLEDSNADAPLVAAAATIAVRPFSSASIDDILRFLSKDVVSDGWNAPERDSRALLKELYGEVPPPGPETEAR